MRGKKKTMKKKAGTIRMPKKGGSKAMKSMKSGRRKK